MSKIYEVSDKDLPSLFREVEGRRPAAIQRGIASAIMLSAELVAQAAPKDLGDLKRSVRGVVSKDGGGYVVVDAGHAGIVEMGARPHWTSIKNLLPWCIRHAAPGENPYRFAKFLQRKIATVGQKPTYFMRKTLPKQKRILKAEVEHEMHAEG
jgi:hypothetical protein